MADGAVLSGIPRQMALQFSAHAMMVSGSLYNTLCYNGLLTAYQSAARLVLEKGQHPAEVGI